MFKRSFPTIRYRKGRSNEDTRSLYYPLYTTSGSESVYFEKKIKKYKNCKISEILSIKHEIMNGLKEVYKRIGTIEKPSFILRLLDTIIPDRYFGRKSNRKLFYLTVKKILGRSSKEYIHTAELIRDYDYKSIPWLNATIPEFKLDVTFKGMPPQKASPRDRSARIGFLKKTLLRNVIEKMIKENHLLPIASLESDTIIRGSLKIVMKNGISDADSYRPIIKLSKTIKQRNELRNMSRHILVCASKYSLTKTDAIYQNWIKYVQRVRDSPIYGVKVDVSDAFGNVNIESLCLLLKRLISKGDVKKLPKNVDCVTEHIRNQYIVYQRTKKKQPRIGKWNHGVLQGDPLSSALCQLYMSHLDRLHLKEFYHDNSFLHRTVDDYFYCSTNKLDIRKFTDVISRIHKINEEKTENTLGENSTSIISYCGKLFCLNTKEVKCHYQFEKGSTMKDKCKLWNPAIQIHALAPNLFVTRALNFRWNNYYFGKLYLNTVFNSNFTVLENFFEAMIFIAFKFDAALMAVYYPKMQKNFLLPIILKTVEEYSTISVAILRKNGNEQETQIPWKFCFIKVGFRAFLLVLQRRHQVYKEVLDELKKHYKCVIIPGKISIDMGRFKKLPEAFLNLREFYFYDVEYVFWKDLLEKKRHEKVQQNFVNNSKRE